MEYLTTNRLTLIIILTLLYTSVFGKVWRINNSDDSADYESITQAQLDDIHVFEGDTLYLEGSLTSYDGTINKRFVIIGPGYYLNENAQGPYSNIEARLHNVYVRAEGVYIVGINLGSIYIYDDQVVIEKCRFDQIQLSSCSNVIIRQSIGDRISVGGVANIIVKNSIVNDINSSSGVFSEISNNTFLGSVTASANIFRNNILFEEEAFTNSYNIVSATTEYNLAKDGVLGTENGNKLYAEGDVIFVADGTSDSKWMLDAESTYKSSGKGGTDPGAFGGNLPYELSGLPNLPIIYEIETSGVGNDSDGLPVRIKVRSN
ncbi:MAG: hypothetical protein RIC35_19510 [Marinoscillum sp.]